MDGVRAAVSSGGSVGCDAGQLVEVHLRDGLDRLAIDLPQLDRPVIRREEKLARHRTLAPAQCRDLLIDLR